ASTGPIITYGWSHNAGAAINVAGLGTATPSFLAPSLPAPLDITFTLTVRDVLGNSSTDTMVVHVAAVPPVIDVLTISAARYVISKNSWRVNGTASQHRGQTISVFLGPIGDTTRPIGSAVVSASGAWTLQTLPGASRVPFGTDSAIWASSSLGGSPVSAPFLAN